MHIKSEKAKKTTKYTLYLTQELTENTQRPINKAQKVMTIHIINNVRVPLHRVQTVLYLSQPNGVRLEKQNLHTTAWQHGNTRESVLTF